MCVCGGGKYGMGNYGQSCADGFRNSVKCGKVADGSCKSSHLLKTNKDKERRNLNMKSKIHWLTAFSAASLTIIALIESGKIAVRAKQAGDSSPTINAQPFQFKGKTASESKVNLIPNAQPVNSQASVLEAYTIGQGGAQSLSLDGFDSRLTDQGFGATPNPGAAKSIMQFSTARDHSNLFLQVYRTLPPGTIAFALIVTRVEVRAFNSQGVQMYSRDLGGFVFADGASGNWSQSLNDLPANVAQIKVTFFGNYE